MVSRGEPCFCQICGKPLVGTFAEYCRSHGFFGEIYQLNMRTWRWSRRYRGYDGKIRKVKSALEMKGN